MTGLLIDKRKNTGSITQSNQLVEASYTLTLNEKRLLMLGLSTIDPRRAIGREDRLSFTVTVDQWAARFPDEKPWRAMKRAADNMLSRYITLHPKTGHVRKITWFESVDYIEGAGRVEVQLGLSVSLRLSGMLDEFTRIQLTAIQQLRSFHSVRLYELVCQFRSTGFRRISLEDFRIAMDCAGTKYPEVKALKRRVLNPALADINEKSDIRVVCQDMKVGRRIVGFEFTILAPDSPPT